MSPAGITERTTGRDLIDKALTEAGWRVVSDARWLTGDHTTADAVEEVPTDSDQADYLLHLDGQPVVDVEAKNLSAAPRNLMKWAKSYT